MARDVAQADLQWLYGQFASAAEEAAREHRNAAEWSPSGTRVRRYRPGHRAAVLTDASTFGLDPAYPRNIVRDHPADVSTPDLTSALDLTGPLRYAGDGSAEFKPSEWIAPWRYPISNQAGQPVPQEGAPVHVGPYVVGDQSTVLLPGAAGDNDARQKLEEATSPAETSAALDKLLAKNRHLGGPVDYSIYLVGRMLATGQKAPPDFNLDSDRGYAWQCWDWERHTPDEPWKCVPDFTETPQADFSYAQPCTPPQFFHADHDNPHQTAAGAPLDSQWYDPHRDLGVHYLSGGIEPPPTPVGDDPCQQGKPRDLIFGLDWKEALHKRDGDQR